MIFKAIILGIVEGLTEFLPVSSTGHLIIINKFIAFSGKFANVFDVVIQTGAILAVLIYFRKKLFPKFKKIKDIKKYTIWFKIVTAFIPAAILGFLFDDMIEAKLFNTYSVAIALVVGALFMLFAEKLEKKFRVTKETNITYRDALIIGFIQCLAMWPGISRSAATIIGGLFIGFSPVMATEFSFFLAIPTLLAAGAFKLLKTGLSFSTLEWATLGVGTLVSFLVAYAVVAVFIKYVQTKKLAPFAYYRIALGLLLLLLVK